MRTDWEECLDAVLKHVEDLKDQGVRFLPVTPQTLAALRVPSPKESTGRTTSSTEIPSSTALTSPAPTAPVGPETGSIGVATDLDSNDKNQTAASLKTKAAALAELRERALVCQNCPHLARSRKSVVFGVGDMNARLMFVGEAPGADEDEQGEPFVGAAGQLLTRIIRAMGFSRDSVYIANILKCRPDTPGQSFGNRKPTAEEMKTCLPYLLAQIELIEPEVIVALGATAVEGLLGLTGGISKLRGSFQSLRGLPVMPTYHPSYLLRSEALAVKRQVWEDMLRVLEKLDVPITEKQRSYFLKAP